MALQCPDHVEQVASEPTALTLDAGVPTHRAGVRPSALAAVALLEQIGVVGPGQIAI